MSPLPFFLHEASLIRGNRANCALFCDNLDWLVSKLDRLEASSGDDTPHNIGGEVRIVFFFRFFLCRPFTIASMQFE